MKKFVKFKNVLEKLRTVKIQIFKIFEKLSLSDRVFLKKKIYKISELRRFVNNTKSFAILYVY